MKVFVSSTCYDLIDLRAELYSELRDLGAECFFSDLPDSDFVVEGEPTVDSIEVCLANLRACGTVVFVLSQRYGGRLGERYENLSATHREYREAVAAKKRIYFYVRDRLEAEYAVWKRSPDTFKGAWIKSPADAGLFGLMEEHRKLSAGLHAPNNNWLIPFRHSFEMRADLRKRLRPAALQARALKLIEAGQVPIVTVTGQGVGREHAESTTMTSSWTRFKFWLSNVGPTPAIGLRGRLTFPEDKSFAPPDAALGALVLGAGDKLIQFDVSDMDRVTGLKRGGVGTVKIWAILDLSYTTPLGHNLTDRWKCHVAHTNDGTAFVDTPVYIGKRIDGHRPVVDDPT